jgi:hypothetical protein
LAYFKLSFIIAEQVILKIKYIQWLLWLKANTDGLSDVSDFVVNPDYGRTSSHCRIGEDRVVDGYDLYVNSSKSYVMENVVKSMQW